MKSQHPADGDDYTGPVNDRQMPRSHSGNVWILLAILVPITGVALWLQLNTYPNHDVAWVLWGTRELLTGAQWGVDIIEPNPPLAWYLSMPTTAIAGWWGLPLDWTFRFAVALAAALSAGSFAWLLRGRDSNFRHGVLCATAGACLLLLPGREFGQREHLAAIAVLPYLALASQRIGVERIRLSATAIGIGLAAGLGVALKPYFIAVPVLVEIAVQLLGRRHPRLLRPENMTLGAVIAVYAIFLIVFEPAYLSQVVPLANEIYWSFDLPWNVVWSKLLLPLVAAIPVGVYALYKRDEVGIMLTAAFCGFAISYLVQHKGYAYHLLPVTVISLILLAHFLTTARSLVRLIVLAIMLELTFIHAGPVVAWWQVNRSGGARAAEVERIRNSILAHARNGSFMVVAVHPYPTFPTAIYAPAQYVSRTNSQWFLPAVVQVRAGGGQHADAASIEKHAREFILHDLSARPDLVLIDTDSGRHTVGPKGFDVLAFYLEDPEFRSAWKPYKEIEPIGAYRQFVRAHPTSPLPGRIAK